jgi:hypothetical protein
MVRHLVASFDQLFTREHCERDIRQVVHAIEGQQPLVALLRNDHVPIWTIFAAFDIGDADFVPVEAEAKEWHCSTELVRFCKLAAKIAVLTEQLTALRCEPTDGQKNVLLADLQQFLAILPPPDEFRVWCGLRAEETQ